MGPLKGSLQNKVYNWTFSFLRVGFILCQDLFKKKGFRGGFVVR